MKTFFVRIGTLSVRRKTEFVRGGITSVRDETTFVRGETFSRKERTMALFRFIKVVLLIIHCLEMGTI